MSPTSSTTAAAAVLQTVLVARLVVVLIPVTTGQRIAVFIHGLTCVIQLDPLLSGARLYLGFMFGPVGGPLSFGRHCADGILISVALLLGHQARTIDGLIGALRNTHAHRRHQNSRYQLPLHDQTPPLHDMNAAVRPEWKRSIAQTIIRQGD